MTDVTTTATVRTFPTLQPDGAPPLAQAKAIVLQLATVADEAPRWWSPRRDAYLAVVWPTLPFIAGAIYSAAARRATLPFRMTGPRTDVEYARRILDTATFGKGWADTIILVAQDLLTQDNGAAFEILRPAVAKWRGRTINVKRMYDPRIGPYWVSADDPLERIPDSAVTDDPTEPPIGIAHLDIARCTRTGDPQYPILYKGVEGGVHPLAAHQVVLLEDLPSPREEMHGVGYCALTRVLWTARLVRDLIVYAAEKVSGRFARAVHLTNVDPATIYDAIARAQAEEASQGYVRYSQPIIASTLSPEGKPEVATIELASLPDGFDLETYIRWAVVDWALGFGSHYAEFAPLPGSRLGVATEAQVMERGARGRGIGLFMRKIEHIMNTMVLPQTVRFAYDEVDPQEEREYADAAYVRARTRYIRVQSGEITPGVARRLAIEDEDLRPEHLQMLEEHGAGPGD